MIHSQTVYNRRSPAMDGTTFQIKYRDDEEQ